MAGAGELHLVINPYVGSKESRPWTDKALGRGCEIDLVFCQHRGEAGWWVVSVVW